MWRQFIVIVFAVAALAVSGLSGASAAAVVAGDAAVLSAVVLGCEAGPERARVIAFHPCGKMRNGMTIQCHVDCGVVPDPDASFVATTPGDAATIVSPPVFLEIDSSVYRPPRVA